MTRRRLWRYVAAGLALVPVAAAGLLYAYGLEETLIRYETGRYSVFAWLAVPLALALVAFGWRTIATQRAETRETERAYAAAKTKEAAEAAASEQREYALEVLLLGMSVDKLRQHNLWEAVRKSDPFAMIRSAEPKDYPWSAQEKGQNAGKRNGDAFEHGAAWSPTHWAVPSFMGGGPVEDPIYFENGKLLVTAGIGMWQSVGMHSHMFAATGRRFGEHIDALLADVFAFFDANPDVPYVILFVDDGEPARDGGAMRDTPKRVRDGHYVPALTDTSVCLLLGRRERMEGLRRVAVDGSGLIPGIADVYSDLKQKHKRIPEADEWLAAARDYAATFPWRKSPRASQMDRFRPTPWFPQPWTKLQFEWFDRLPLLGYVHRPQFVSFTTSEGAPMRSDARTTAFAAGWRAALATLPEGTPPPARAFYATGAESARVALLSAAMNEIGPKLELFNPAETVDFDKKLGDTGVATFFAQIALAVIAGYREGGATAVVNLRDAASASIVMVRPPPADNRKPHPAGGDVFRYGVMK